MVRTRLARTLAPARRVQVLHEVQVPLVELMQRSRDPRWSAAAALELARNQAALVEALREAPVPSTLTREDRRRYRADLERRVQAMSDVRARLLRRLAAAAGTDGGLDRHTLAAVHESSASPGPRWRLPGKKSPALPLIAAGRHRAAERVATAALAVHGPRADLLCSRAVARLGLDRPRDALKDLRRALQLTSESRCARDNLNALDRLRGLGNARAVSLRAK
jgi:hypothetical protein